MNNTVAERQRKHRERLYKAGLKPMQIWVKRKENKVPEKMSITEYAKKLREITSGLDKSSLTRLLNIQLKIANGRKEEIKLRKKK